MPEKPDHISAFEQIETFKQFKEVSNANFISSQGNIQDNNSNHHKDEASFLYSVGTFFENRVNDLQNGIKDMKIKEKTGDFSKKAVNYMGEKTNEVIVHILFLINYRILILSNLYLKNQKSYFKERQMKEMKIKENHHFNLILILIPTLIVTRIIRVI